MLSAGVRRLVFSSSAAVYGDTAASQVDEDEPTEPVNPYGRTKLIGEWLCRDLALTGALDVIALRYFNVAGAARPELGDPAVMNLVTMVIDRLRQGMPPMIFGNDYPTPDGTCVRDFVHVRDLADAHVTAVDALAASSVTGFEAFNVGTGVGGSVQQVVDRLVELSGLVVEPMLLGRRAGDPAAVVASADLIRRRLGWSARAGLQEILDSAWAADAPTRSPESLEGLSSR
jgi:UDP-glucose 4-epimerase